MISAREEIRNSQQVDGDIESQEQNGAKFNIELRAVCLFGGKKIPELMRGLGKGVKSFKDGVNEAKEEINKAQEDLDKPAEKK